MTTRTRPRAFHFVAAAGGCSQAVREMWVRQSTLSSQVRQLETASDVALTPDGAAL